MSTFFVIFVAQIFVFIANCKDFHPIAGDYSSKVIYWSNFDIEDPSSSATANPSNVKKLIFVIHGFGRTVSHYYRAIETAAKLEGYNVANGDILLIAPKFKISDDNPDANDIYYDNGWIYGDMSITKPAISSYAVIDSFFEYILLDQSSVFNQLSEVVLLGHSAGGQFVQRYALTNKLSSSLNSQIHFIIANPSSFAYLDGRRWFDGQTLRELTTSEKAACPDYDSWKFGFADNSLANYSPYFATDSLENSKWNFIDRTVSYLLGAADTCPSKTTIEGAACSMPAADGCGADLQGTFRLERGLNFWRSLVAIFGDRVQNKHRLQIVPFAGHDEKAMFESEYARPVIFNSVKSAQCGYISDACKGHVNWALTTGRNTNPEWYEFFETVTLGVKLADATEKDMILYFYCQSVNPDNECSGLQMPCNSRCGGV